MTKRLYEDDYVDCINACKLFYHPYPYSVIDSVSLYEDIEITPNRLYELFRTDSTNIDLINKYNIKYFQKIAVMSIFSVLNEKKQKIN